VLCRSLSPNNGNDVVSIASTFLSITTQRLLSETQSSTFGINAFARPLPAVVLPSVCIRSHPVPPSHSSPAVSLSATSSFSFDAHLPVVYVSLTKPLLDGLTFWADDFAQRLFGDLGRASVSDTSGKSRDPSMIGSRFFVKRTASTGSSESGREVRKSEVVVKVSIGEGRCL
jgi:autophagy-related protein 2